VLGAGAAMLIGGTPGLATGGAGDVAGAEVAGAGCRRMKTCQKSRAWIGSGAKPRGTTGARRVGIAEAPGDARGCAGEAPGAARGCALETGTGVRGFPEATHGCARDGNVAAGVSMEAASPAAYGNAGVTGMSSGRPVGKKLWQSNRTGRHRVRRCIKKLIGVRGACACTIRKGKAVLVESDVSIEKSISNVCDHQV
jgi:hypothetical protein